MMSSGSHRVTGGWVHDVSFSASGDQLAFVAHDSSITVVDSANNNAFVHHPSCVCLLHSGSTACCVWSTSSCRTAR